jgi:oligoribonuclease (3'-5' exoribonuclease)
MCDEIHRPPQRHYAIQRIHARCIDVVSSLALTRRWHCDVQASRQATKEVLARRRIFEEIELHTFEGHRVKKLVFQR